MKVEKANLIFRTRGLSNAMPSFMGQGYQHLVRPEVMGRHWPALPHRVETLCGKFLKADSFTADSCTITSKRHIRIEDKAPIAVSIAVSCRDCLSIYPDLSEESITAP